MNTNLVKIKVIVYDFNNNRLSGAEVTLTKTGVKGEMTRLTYDEKSKVYYTSEQLRGVYLIKVEAEGYESQEREVDIDQVGIEEIFIMGKKGMPYVYRGRVKMPFLSQDDLIAVSFKDGFTGEKKKKFASLVKELKLKEEKVGVHVKRSSIAVYRLSHAKDRQKTHEALMKNKAVNMAGPIVRMDDESVSFLTNEIIVKFKGNVKKEDAVKIVKKMGLEIVQELIVAKNVYLLRSKKIASYELLDVCEQFLKSGKVDWAESNLMSSAVDDVVNPADFLYPQQWHHQIVDTPSAWQRLRSVLGVNSTFGDPNIIIAVMDSGIDAAHPDLSGNLTNGNPKIYRLLDCVNLTANNNVLDSYHGTSCAGVAAARANNPSVVAGETEGCAGAAGNCRLMGLRRNGPENRYSDAYLWAAGFAPAGAGFPPTPAPGADIITNSFGYSVGLPISALMQNTFDFITNNGRGGRGTLLFFSAGNNSTDFTLQRPWAAYTRTFAIAASSIANDGITEINADYSNYGGDGVNTFGIIDVCAPSNDSFPTQHNPPLKYAVTTTDIRGQGNLAGHTGGGLDYRDNFGGTSSATPFTAGIAALVLTADPTLTWIQVRDLLRNTATKIDFANVDPIGQYFDTNSDGVADYSRRYGYGRVNARAAIYSLLPKILLKDIKDAIDGKRFRKEFIKEYLREKIFHKDKERIDEVKFTSYDKMDFENPFERFERYIDPAWFEKLEERIKLIESEIEGRAFIGKEERPEVAEKIIL